MLKRKLCEAVFRWELNCEGPLLIADGRYQSPKEKQNDKNKQAWPDQIFISHDRPDTILQRMKAKPGCPPELSYYVPGTSLRGPFRAQAECIVRSLLAEDLPQGTTACDPFEQSEAEPLYSCSKRLEKTTDKYREACPACRLFGCAGLASRISFSDAELDSGYKSTYRDMIGIDRFTGAVFTGGDSGGGANMRFHVLENTRFTTTVTLVNFELWQLGLLAYVFQDFKDGLVAIGFGKTKGFGRVRAELKEIRLSYPAGRAGGRLQHLGSLADAEELLHYGLHGADAPPVTLHPVRTAGISLYEHFTIKEFEAAAAAFNDYVDTRKAEVPE